MSTTELRKKWENELEDSKRVWNGQPTNSLIIDFFLSKRSTEIQGLIEKIKGKEIIGIENDDDIIRYLNSIL